MTRLGEIGYSAPPARIEIDMYISLVVRKRCLPHM
jgi:hypothetical protein